VFQNVESLAWLPVCGGGLHEGEEGVDEGDGRGGLYGGGFVPRCNECLFQRFLGR
jgi:hypothetical protein